MITPENPETQWTNTYHDTAVNNHPGMVMLTKGNDSGS